MIFPDKHTVTSFRTKHMLPLGYMVATILCALILLGGKSLSGIGERDGGNQSIQISITNSLGALEDELLLMYSIPSHPHGCAHNENMIEPESVQDDDVSEDLLLITEARPDHSLDKGRIQLSSGSFATRPNISLIILHHSWKMHLS